MRDLNDLAILASVATKLSFEAAGRELGLSASTISRRITAIEQRLGVALVVRTTRSVRLTAAGADFASHCRAVVESAERAEAAVDAHRTGIEGKLRIDAPVLFGRLVLTPILASFAKAHPAVQVHLTLNDRRVDVSAENVDVVFRTGALPSSGLRARRLADATAVVVASEGCLARHVTPRTLADLTRVPCLCLDHAGDARWRCASLPDPIDVHAAFVASDLEVLRAMAIEGLGFALLPRFALEDALRDGRLKVVDLDVDLGSVPISIVYPGHKIPNRCATLFTELVVAVCADEHAWPSAQGA